ncbi:MAG: LCP family protein [Lachnospiraceae bacterium]|nr:LCP family protein [Lachnospiraceae bacterium]
MKTEDFKMACDEIQMTSSQRQKAWRRAKRQAENKRSGFGRLSRMVPAFGIVLAAMMIVVIVIPWANWSWQRGAAALIEKSVEETEINSKPADEIGQTVMEEGYETYLVLGLDGQGNKGGKADAIVLVSRHVATNQIKLISIPRELLLDGYAGNEVTELERMTNLYYYGGADQLVHLVEAHMGIPLDGWISFEWSCVAELINILGGVELEVTEEEIERAYITGYLTEVVGKTGIGTDGQFEQAGLQVLDGPKAVAWSRVYQLEEQQRETRMITLLKETLKAAKHASVTELIQCMINVYDGSVKTDLSLDTILELMDGISQYQIAASMNLSDAQAVELVDQNEVRFHIVYYQVTDWIQLQEELHLYLYGRLSGEEKKDGEELNESYKRGKQKSRLFITM